ncbi:oocyte zinc finger protein XlCOF26-like isoform X2 [Malaya genurostris]|nr:oocyte zinc finger protein XlCOF26-like isoform X2 [Malaya genurostris]XP_058448097.1 oocyte zinc finger protein XlCOF26-like isoform X2 [Malaya genurostris]XP_058448098.1 oocyte zinc finger protein XlCOF26-like isoform X2 [Malaya genurostris]
MDPICRLCMEVSNLSQSLADKTILSMVEDCIQIKLDMANDLLPIEICDDCYHTIKDFSEFKENCHDIQGMLLKEIKKSRRDEDLETDADSLLELFDGDIRYSDVEYIDENLFDDINTDNLLKDIENNNVIINDNTKDTESCTDSTDSLKSEKKKKPKRCYKNEYIGALITCEICGKIVHKTLIPGHINMHNGVKPYTCPRDGCKSSFHCKHKLKRHIGYKHSGGSFSCEKCEKIFNSHLALYHHRFASHQERDKTCQSCGKQFRTTHGLNRHMRTHNEERKFKCSYCTLTFVKESSRDTHHLTHTKERPYICPKCSADYSNRRLLVNHIKRKHPGFDQILPDIPTTISEKEQHGMEAICEQ